MPKRKFSETEDSLDQLPEAVLNKARRQRKRVGRTIDNSKIVLTKALSSARISERQKLGRRQKDAHQENKSLDLARIDKEIEALRVSSATHTLARFADKVHSI